MVFSRNFKKKCLIIFIFISFLFTPFITVNAAEIDISNLGYREWITSDLLYSPFDASTYSDFLTIFPSTGVYKLNAIFFSGINMEAQFNGMLIDNNSGNISYVSSSSSGSGATSVLVFTGGIWTDSSYSKIIFFPNITSGQSIHELAYAWLISVTKPFTSTSLIGDWFANEFLRPLSYESVYDFDLLGNITIDNVDYYKIKFFGNYTNFIVTAYKDPDDLLGIKLYDSSSFWKVYEYRYFKINALTNTPTGFVDFFLLNFSTFTDNVLLFDINGYYVFLDDLSLPVSNSILLNIPFSSRGKVYNRMLITSTSINYIFYNVSSSSIIYNDTVYEDSSLSVDSPINWFNDDYRFIYFSPAKISSSTRSFMLANGVFNYTPPNKSSTVRDLIFAFCDIPVHIISSLLSFEVFGTAAFSVFCSLVLVSVAIFILKKVL